MTQYKSSHLHLLKVQTKILRLPKLFDSANPSLLTEDTLMPFKGMNIFFLVVCVAERSMEVLKVVVVAAMVMMRAAEAIWLELPNSETKCVYEDIRNNVVVIGDYVVLHDDDEHAQPNFIPTISIQVN